MHLQPRKARFVLTTHAARYGPRDEIIGSECTSEALFYTKGLAQYRTEKIADTIFEYGGEGSVHLFDRFPEPVDPKTIAAPWPSDLELDRLEDDDSDLPF